jgi:hypothetical protein
MMIPPSITLYYSSRLNNPPANGNSILNQKLYPNRFKDSGCRIYWLEDGINFIIRLGVLYWNRGRKQEREREISFMNIGSGRM